MRKSLLNLLRCPKSSEPLSLYVFNSNDSSSEEDDVMEGILLDKENLNVYPITKGVPIMIESSFPPDFVKRNSINISQIKEITGLNITSEQSKWTFSIQWEYHSDYELNKTWGWSTEKRMKQFFLEVGVTPEWCKDKLILDAGCGNGQLSECLSNLGANVIALDYSTSVFHAESVRKSSSVHYIQGDLQAPPFGSEIFDLIISNGVLHHTPNTYRTFIQVARLVKPKGLFYLWLYRKPDNFIRRFVLYPALDFTRTLTSRLPQIPQAVIVKSYAFALMLLHKILNKRNDLTWRNRVVTAYDTLTPRWRHYHTPLEISCWFFLQGYSAATITHWDNPSGFGMVARREPQSDTPGLNFEKTSNVKRYWK